MNKRKAATKQKMTKEQRRAKYTKLAHDRRDAARQKQRVQNMICFKCRRRGHMSSQCDVKEEELVCYKCGSQEHSLQECDKYKKGDTDLPFATCYVCHSKGHLASACPQNSKGMYVNGGCCRVCGSKQHPASHCPQRVKSEEKSDGVPNESYDDLLEPENKKSSSSPVNKKAKKKVVTF